MALVFGRILAAIGLRGLLVIAILCAFLGYHLNAVHQAKEQGRAEIRIDWAEANRRADVQALARQQRQQARIDVTGAELARQRALAAATASHLETALAEERAKNDAQDRKGAAVCLSPPMSDGVRGALNAIR